MALNERDRTILEHIVSYCDDIYETVARFGDSIEAFQSLTLSGARNRDSNSI